MTRFLEDIRSARRILKTGEHTERRYHLANLRLLLPYLKKHWKKMVLASALTIVVSLFALPVPLLMKYTIDTIIPEKSFRMLNLVVLFLVSIQIVKMAISFLTNYYFNVLNQGVLLSLKDDLSKKILNLPLSYFDGSQTGYIMSRIGEVGGLGIFFSSSAVRILIAFFEFIFCLLILLHLHSPKKMVAVTWSRRVY